MKDFYEMPRVVAIGCVAHVDGLLEKAAQIPESVDNNIDETIEALSGLRNSLATLCNAGIDPIIVPEHHQPAFAAVVAAEADRDSQPLMTALTLVLSAFIELLKENNDE